MRRTLPAALAAFALGFFARAILYRTPPPVTTPETIVVNFPAGPGSGTSPELRAWKTLTVVPDRPENGERGLWFVKLMQGSNVTQYRCRTED